MQYKVPQNVDIEDKVIGPLTIRQFIILLVAIGILLILNFILIGPLRMIFYLVAFVIGGLAVTLAFFKYGDQNMEVFLLSAWKTFVNPRKRVWKKEVEAEKKEPVEKAEKAEKETPAETRVDVTSARDNLEKLAEVVDSGGYSTLSPERRGNFSEKKPDDTDAPDLLASAEAPSNEVDKMIDSTTTPKREQLVSEAASVSPDRAQAETPKIKLRKDQYYKKVK